MSILTDVISGVDSVAASFSPAVMNDTRPGPDNAPKPDIAVNAISFQAPAPAQPSPARAEALFGPAMNGIRLDTLAERMPHTARMAAEHKMMPQPGMGRFG